MSLRDTAWMADARCAEVGPELFFPPPDQGAAAQVLAAKRVCNSCEVKDECLEYALRTKLSLSDGEQGWISGVWGGLSSGELERERYRRGLTKPLNAGLLAAQKSIQERKPVWSEVVR